MCEYCEKQKYIKSRNFCGRAKARIVGAEIDISGDEKKIRWFKSIYAPAFKINYCPMRGRKLTDEENKVEMKPVIHAHAIIDWLGNPKCSNCGDTGINVTEPYCLHCGARLDEPEVRI